MSPKAPKKQQLREQRGRSIMENSTKSTVSANVLTDRTIRTPHLTEAVINDLKALYPYICEAPYANIPFQELLFHFRCDTYPEGEVFWWQLDILSVLHALNLWTFPGLIFQKPPPPDAKLLAEPETLEKYYRFPEATRKKFQRTVFELLMIPSQFSVDCPEDLCILESTTDVCDSRSSQSDAIERGRALRYAKAYGAACSYCKHMAKGMMVCSRCSKSFYCGRECQKAHWPAHKKECGKQPSGPTKSSERPSRKPGRGLLYDLMTQQLDT